MSGENQTIGELLKFVDSDFKSALQYFRSGINNVLYAIVNNMASEVIVESDINGFLLSELIEKVYPAVEFLVCDSSYIVFKVQDKCVSVICRDNRLKFQVRNGKSDKE